MNQKYEILDLLGQGTFGFVYSAKNKNNELFAIKITDTSFNEINNLSIISAHSSDYVICFYEYYRNDKKLFIVTELLGCSLYEFMNSSYNLGTRYGVYVKNASLIMKQVLSGLKFLNQTCKLIHTDLKPENILLTKSLKQLSDMNINFGVDYCSELHCKIVDLGNACFINNPSNKFIQTREYRSLEAVLGGSYNETCDIWSIGCIAYELLTNEQLFRPRSKRNKYTHNQHHIYLMMRLLGPIKKELISGVLCEKIFKDIKMVNVRYIGLYKYLKTNIGKIKTDIIYSFLKSTLVYDKNKRATVDDCLHNYFINL